MPRGRTACGGLGDLDRVDRDLVSARIVALILIGIGSAAVWGTIVGAVLISA